MSILLDDALLQYLRRTTTVPAVSFPFAIQCAVRLDDLSLDQTLVSLVNQTTGHHHSLVFKGGTTGNPVAARTTGAAGTSDAQSSLGIGSVTYAIITGVWISDSERHIYINGVGMGSNTDNRPVTGIDAFAVGALDTTIPSLYVSGEVADVAIWSGLPSGGFSAAEIENLGVDKISPLLIRPDELISFSPLPAATPDPSIDVVGSFDLTQINSPVDGTGSPATETFDPPITIPPGTGPIEVSVEHVVTCSQSIVTSIHGGPALNACAASVAATNNVIQDSASNSCAATPSASVDNVIQVSISVSCGASVAATNNVKQGAVVAGSTGTPSAGNNVKQDSASHTCAASASAASNIKIAEASNTCGATANAGREINVQAFTNAPVLQSAQTNQICYPEIEHTVTVEQTVGLNVEYNINIVQPCYADAKANRCVEGSASTTAGASVSASRGDDAESIVTVTPTASGETCSYASSSCGAQVTVSATIERNLAVTSTCGATVTADAYIVKTGCDLNDFAPQGTPLATTPVLSTRDTITLVCGADSVTLRNPSFGNEDDLQIVRALSRSRHGTYSTFRDSAWPKSQIKTFSVSLLKRTEAQDLLDFQLNCLGKEVTYTDPEDRAWIGTILNPEEALVANRIDQYTVNFRFRGVLTTEKTW